MSDLTKEEKQWVRRVQRALSACPSLRLGFYTTGDDTLTIYDKDKGDEITAIYDTGRGEFCNAVDDANAYLGELTFPAQVEGTAG